MKIIRNEEEYTLTLEELREAYWEQKRKYQIQDAERYLSSHLFGENNLEEHDFSQTLMCRENYGIEPEAFFDEESSYYILDQIVEDYNSECDCNIPKNTTYSDVISRILENLVKENPNRGMIPLSDDSFLPEIKLWSTEEYTLETDESGGDDYLSLYIPITFDVWKALNLPKDNEDMVNMYVSYFPEKKDIRMFVCYIGTIDEYSFDVALSNEQKDILVRTLNVQSKIAYGYDLDNLVEREKDSLVANKPEVSNAKKSNKETEGYSIYQLQSEDTERIRYMSFRYLVNRGIRPEPCNYNCVYEICCSVPNSNEEKAKFLEEIYTEFNLKIPENFKGHSLSVSDVVVLKNRKGITAYYCDSIGFKDITEFWNHIR